MPRTFGIFAIYAISLNQERKWLLGFRDFSLGTVFCLIMLEGTSVASVLLGFLLNRDNLYLINTALVVIVFVGISLTLTIWVIFAYRDYVSGK